MACAKGSKQTVSKGSGATNCMTYGTSPGDALV